MSESYFEKRRKELGLSSDAVASSTPSSDFFERRKADLGLVEAPQRTVQQVQETVRTPSPTPSPLPSVEKQLRTATSAFKGVELPQTRREWVQEQTMKNREKADKNPVTRVLNRLIEPVVTTINAAQSYLPGVTSFQKGAGTALNIEADTAPFKGPAFIEKPAEYAGMLAGAVTNPSNISQGLVTTPYQAANALVQGTRLGRAATRLGQNAVARGANAVNPALNQAGINIGSRLTDDVAERALVGSAAGAVQGGVVSGVRGETDIDEVVKNASIGAALGGAGDVILPAAGTMINTFVERLRSPKNVSPEIEQATTEAFNRISSSDKGIPTGTLRQAPQDSYVNKVMSDIKDEVYQRMTPPQENPNELAKWLRSHLGDDISLNEIRKLSFNEMTELAAEAQKNMSMYDVARQVASTKGYDLEKILNNEIPSIKSSAERLRMGRVAGAIEQPNVNVRRAVPKTEAAAPDQPTGQIAADDQGVLGFSPLGSSGRKFTHPEDTRTYIATKTEREPLNISKMADDFYTKSVDNLQRINDFDKFIEKQTGKKLDADERAYMLALNSRGADMTANHILTERLVDSRGNVIGSSLKDITSSIPPRAYTNFLDYLIAKHAPARMARGETVYNKKAKMTIEKVNQKIADYEKTYPEFKALANQIYEWDAKLGEAWLVDTGVIPPEMLAAWREANPNWSPNQRKFSELEKRNVASGARRGFANQNNPVKKYSPTGSERAIIDPIESRIEYTDRYVKTARRNEVMQTVYRSIQRNPDELDGFAKIIKREKLDQKSVTGEDGIDGLLDSLDEEFNLALRKTDLDKDNVISALIDGERVYMKVEDPAFLDALTNVSPQAQNAVIEAARKVTGTMKSLTTGINPIFGLTRNIFRDIPEAYIYSKTADNPFRFAWDVLDGFTSVFADGGVSAIGNNRKLQKLTPQKFKEFLNNRAALYKDYKAIGGGHSSPAAADRNLLKQSKRQLLPQQRQGLAIFPRALAALENLNNALESGPRLGEFKRVRKAEGDSYASKVKGLYEAQDITTNFKRRGNVVRDADAIVPYLNAAVQGLDKHIRAYKDRPVAVPAKALAVISLPTIALYAMNYNNEAYKKMNNFTKDNFYLIPTEEGKFIKIPKPRELGVPFGGLLERTMRAWSEDDPEAFRDFADTARTMFAPPVIGALLGGKNPLRDTIAGPLVEVDSNENFMGAPIVPGYLEGLSPELQYDANTSEVGKKVGAALNVSPKNVDHLIRSYTGVIGQIGLPATTQGSTLGDTLQRQVTADSVFSTDASKYFYELKDKVDTQYADAKATGMIPEGYNDGVRKYLGDISSQLSDYTKAIRAVDDMDISREEKKNQKRELTDKRNELARQAYTAAREALVQ